MTIDDLYGLVDLILPPLVVALLALAAVASSIIRAALCRRPRVMWLAIGASNVALAYLWTAVARLSLAERAALIRIAIVILLISILVYNQQAHPLFMEWIRERRDRE